MLKQFPAGHPITLWRIVLLTFIGTAPGLDANAQSPAATSSSADKPAEARPADSAAPDDEKTLVELREKLQKAQADLAGTKSKTAGTVPIEATPDELQERHDLLEDIVRGYDEQVTELRRLRDARRQRAEVGARGH